jgi:hypothetical protein
MEMKIGEKEHVIIYFEDWQMRMIKEFLGVDCTHWPVDLTAGVVAKYMPPLPAHTDGKRMYFTEWQRREIKDVTGEDCSFIELTSGMITRYGIPPEELRKTIK